MTNLNTPTLEPNPASAGSAFYFSLQGLAMAKRKALIGLQSFANEIHKITERYQEPDVVTVKLKWWQEELERLPTKPSHPITQWLQPFIVQYQLDTQHLQAILESGHTSLLPQHFNTDAELYRHYQYTGGIIENLKAQVLCHNQLDDTTIQAAHYLGIANEIVRHIVEATHHFYRQQYYFATSDNPQSIAQDTIKRNTLWHQQTLQAQRCYQDATKILNQDIAQGLRPIRLYAHLQLLMLHKIQHQQFPVLERHVELAPLRMLWTSYWFV